MSEEEARTRAVTRETGERGRGRSGARTEQQRGRVEEGELARVMCTSVLIVPWFRAAPLPRPRCMVRALSPDHLPEPSHDLRRMDTTIVHRSYERAAAGGRHRAAHPLSGAPTTERHGGPRASRPAGMGAHGRTAGG